MTATFVTLGLRKFWIIIPINSLDLKKFRPQLLDWSNS